jgi:hypothetical protein
MLKTVSSITNAIGALNYKGTWNASTNTPTLASGVGTKGDYYVVSVAGSTSLDGISNWGVGDLATYNGTTWQRVEGGADLNGVNLSVSGTSTLSGLTANGVAYLNGSKVLSSGTALTFDGTNFGVGVASPTAKLDLSANAAIMGYFRSSGGSANNKRLTFTTGGDRVVIDAAENSTGAAVALVFATGGAEKLRLSDSGNLGFGGTSFGSGVTVFFLANATAPTTNPSGGGILYVEAGALKYRGSSGTVTTIAAA